MKKYELIQIKIPKEIKLLFCFKKNILFVSGTKKEKLIEPTLKIFINEKMFLLNITNVPLKCISKNELKKIKSIQRKLVSDIKSSFLEVSHLFYKKLNLIGIGYRVMLGDGIEKKVNKNFVLKLGYSHLVYYKLPNDVYLYSSKYNKFTIFGSLNTKTIQTITKLRSLKYPEPYKGKGILYKNEKVILKIGKRI